MAQAKTPAKTPAKITRPYVKRTVAPLPQIEIVHIRDSAQWEVLAGRNEIWLHVWTRSKAEAHLNNAPTINMGTKVDIYTGLQLTAPKGYRFEIEIIRPGFLLVGFAPSLEYLTLYNAVSPILTFKHGDPLAYVRLAHDIPFTVKDTGHAV